MFKANLENRTKDNIEEVVALKEKVAEGIKRY